MSVQTIQQTGKFWKLLAACCWLGIFVGILWTIATFGDATPENAAKGMVIAASSFGALLMVKVGGWFFHG